MYWPSFTTRPTSSPTRILGGVAIIAGIVALPMSPRISRLMKGVHRTSTRISASNAGSMLPPETIATVGPGGVAAFR